MTHHIRIRATTAVAALVGLVGLAAGPAFAVATPTTPTASGQETAALIAIKANAALAVNQRVAALNMQAAAVLATNYMGADQTSVVAADRAAAAGLTQLNSTIQADTTVLAARVHAGQIGSQFRVYALVIPAGHLVRAADAITNLAVPKLTSLAATMHGLLTPANSANLQPLLTDMANQTAAAAQDVAGLAGQLEGYRPGQWNADRQLLTPALTSIRAARAALRQASKDAHLLANGLLRANGGQR